MQQEGHPGAGGVKHSTSASAGHQSRGADCGRAGRSRSLRRRHHDVDNSDSGRSLYRSGDQRLSSGRILSATSRLALGAAGRDEPTKGARCAGSCPQIAEVALLGHLPASQYARPCWPLPYRPTRSMTARDIEAPPSDARGRQPWRSRALDLSERTSGIICSLQRRRI